MEKLLGEFSPQTLTITFSNNHYVPPQELSPMIEDLWNDLLTKKEATGSQVWNGTVYRLEQIENTPTLSILHLGLTEYKMTYCTPYLKESLASLPFSQRPNGMYISSYLRTSDNAFIFSQKNSNSLQKNNINLLGGSLNYDEMKIEKSSDLFDYFYKELEEETILDVTTVNNSHGLGIYQSETLRIGVFLFTQLTLSANDFMSMAIKNFEHERFIIVPANDLEGFITEHTESINPNIIETYKLVLKN